MSEGNLTSKTLVWSDGRIMDELGDYDRSLSPEHVEMIFNQALALIKHREAYWAQFDHYPKGDAPEPSGEPVAWCTGSEWWGAHQSETVRKLTRHRQPEHGFTTPLYRHAEPPSGDYCPYCEQGGAPAKTAARPRGLQHVASHDCACDMCVAHETTASITKMPCRCPTDWCRLEPDNGAQYCPELGPNEFCAQQP